MNEISKLWFDSYKIGPSFMLLFLFYFVRAPKIAYQKYQCIKKLLINSKANIYQIVANFDNMATKMVLYVVNKEVLRLISVLIDLKVGKIEFSSEKLVFTHCLVYLRDFF